MPSLYDLFGGALSSVYNKINPQQQPVVSPLASYQQSFQPNMSTTSGPAYSHPKTGEIYYQNPIQPQGNVLGASATGGGASSGGGTTGGGTTGGGQGIGKVATQPSYISQPNQPNIDFDAMIAPALAALDEAAGAAQTGYQADLSDIEAQRSGGIGRQQQFLTGEEGKAGVQKEYQTTTGEQNVNEQRSALAEVLQGLQSRFGGTTGTGKFAGEIAGRGAMKNIGSIRQGVTQAISTIDQKLGDVRETVRFAIEDIENSTNALKVRAKANLEQNLSNIRGQKGELQGKKAELAYQAMQKYQDTVNDINIRNTQLKNDYGKAAQAAEQKLILSKQQASDYLINLEDVPNIQTPLGKAGLGFTGGEVVGQGGQYYLKKPKIGALKEYQIGAGAGNINPDEEQAF